MVLTDLSNFHKRTFAQRVRPEGTRPVTISIYGAISICYGCDHICTGWPAALLAGSTDRSAGVKRIQNGKSFDEEEREISTGIETRIENSLSVY